MKKTILSVVIAVIFAVAVTQTQNLFGDITTNIVGIKYRYRMFNIDDTPMNIFVEYIYNKKAKSCMARITHMDIDNKETEDPTITNVVYYTDVTAANCK